MSTVPERQSAKTKQSSVSYPAALAREAAGLSLIAAAKLAGISAKYLRDCERSGQFSWYRANVLARLYEARLDAFLPHNLRGGGTPRPRARRPNRARGRAGGPAQKKGRGS